MGKVDLATDLNSELCRCRQLPRRWRASSTPGEAPLHGQDQQWRAAQPAWGRQPKRSRPAARRGWASRIAEDCGGKSGRHSRARRIRQAAKHREESPPPLCLAVRPSSKASFPSWITRRSAGLDSPPAALETGQVSEALSLRPLSLHPKERPLPEAPFASWLSAGLPSRASATNRLLSSLFNSEYKRNAYYK